MKCKFLLIIPAPECQRERSSHFLFMEIIVNVSALNETQSRNEYRFGHDPTGNTPAPRARHYYHK